MGEILSALIGALVGVAAMLIAYRQRRNSKREEQHSRFENFYAALAQAEESEIASVLKLRPSGDFSVREQAYLIWYLTICEGVFHSKRYQHVENVYVDAFMDSLKVKYGNCQTLQTLLESEGFDHDFVEAVTIANNPISEPNNA